MATWTRQVSMQALILQERLEEMKGQRGGGQ